MIPNDKDQCFILLGSDLEYSGRNSTNTGIGTVLSVERHCSKTLFHLYHRAGTFNLYLGEQTDPAATLPDHRHVILQAGGSRAEMFNSQENVLHSICVHSLAEIK